jgi:hypothetical protein
MPSFEHLNWRSAGILALALCSLTVNSCSRHRDSAPYLKLAEAEARYGRLVTAGNHPTEERNGTGSRVGLFLDHAGEIWGLPLDLGSDGAVLACAPPDLRDAKVTDTLPAGASVIGATNEPTGDHGGTGQLELLLRDADGTVSWRAVRGANLEDGPVCHAPRSPGPVLELQYYRLVPAAGGNR